MANIRRSLKRFRLLRSKLIRSIFLGIELSKTKKTKQDRTIVRIVFQILSMPESKVYYSLNESRFYIYSKDKEYIISFNKFHIRITNHRFFFTSDLKDLTGEKLINAATIRMDEDLKKIEAEIVFNEETFLQKVYDSFVIDNNIKE